MEGRSVGDADAIADVGDTLASLLRETASENTTVALASPAEFDPDTTGLSLFLYDVSANSHLTNQPPTVTDDDVERDTPLALELSYLLTAHPSPTDREHDQSSSRKDHHRALGKAMRTFYDNGIVSGAALKGSLGGDDRLHIAMEDRSAEDAIDVWSTFQETPYLPSVSYAVTPVIIESEHERAVHPVEDRTFHYEVQDR